MIRGIHGLLYSSDADATRAFIRDKLRLPHTDVGDGWLIFDLPKGDLGVHPLDEQGQPEPGTHDISFFCDDIKGTMAELQSRGVTFKGEIADAGFGFVTHFAMPGGVEVLLYEPKYAKRTSRSRTSGRPAARGRSKPKGRKRAAERRRR